MSDEPPGFFRGGVDSKRCSRNGFDASRVLPRGTDNDTRKEYRRVANEIIRSFLKSGQKNTTLEPMGRDQRKVMHEVALLNEMTTKSHGREPDRYMILSKRVNRLSKSTLVATEPITPSFECLQKLSKFVEKHPITREEMDEFLTETQTKQMHTTKGHISDRMVIPPKSKCSKELQKVRNSLPASKYCDQVLKSISSCNVVIISGGTGCGKTTQVPQFILDEAHENNKHVRVMVTQPRRIAAISIAERVARERGEPIGRTVGYQVRLDSRRSDDTVLTYCTTGVLLRMLTSDPVASGITHIVMDEIHEREINTDYLLIALRECLKMRPDLKVILMSATIEGNMQLFSNYFENHSMDVIRIESRAFDVKVFYLDQILAMTGYQPPESKAFFSTAEYEEEDWKDEIEAVEREEKDKAKQRAADSSLSTLSKPVTKMAANTKRNSPIEEREWTSGPCSTPDGDIIDERAMRQYMNIIGNPDIRPVITVEFRPTTPNSVFINDVKYTTNPNQSAQALLQQKRERCLMPRGPLTFTCENPASTTKSPPSPTPTLGISSGLAKFTPFGGFGEKQRISTLLEKKFKEELKTALPDRTVYYHPQMNDVVDKTDFSKLRFGEKYNLFYGSSSNNSVDYVLLDQVIQYLADSPVFGTILVFLPGYEDIQQMLKAIDCWKNSLKNMKNVIVLPLHSQMTSINHGDIFKSVPKDTRKIILATNIAEASITIEDVIFVVDTGKVKEKSFDHEAKLSTLTVKPIARSNADQRSGRAGRVANGYCIRLYTEQEYNSMPETQIAEMKRAAIYDVTLHAKLFAPKTLKISEFLSLAPEPPEKESILQAITFLEQIGAFYTPIKIYDNSGNEEGLKNDEEAENSENPEDPELTDLGRLMARLPLDPQLSRMLLFGLALKCLTPIVNLVALLASREPYVLALSEDRDLQSKMKFEMAQQDLSDHLLYIRLCNEFCSKNNSQQNQFCRDHFLNFSTMRMVQGTRRQLLRELVRAKLINISPNRDVLTVLTDHHFNQFSQCWPMIQAVIAAGCYPFIGVSASESNLKKVQTFNDKPAFLHPSSMVKKQIVKMGKSEKSPRVEYVAFQEMCQMPSDRSLSMKTVTVIPSMTALLFTGPIRLDERTIEDNNIIFEEGEDISVEDKPLPWGASLSLLKLDEWYNVRSVKKNLCHFLRLRHKFMHFFVKGISDPDTFGKQTSLADLEMLELIRYVLESENKRYNFAPVVMPHLNLKFYSNSENPYASIVRNDNNRRNHSDPNQKSTERESRKPKEAVSHGNSRKQSKPPKNHQTKTTSNFPSHNFPPPDLMRNSHYNQNMSTSHQSSSSNNHHYSHNYSYPHYNIQLPQNQYQSWTPQFDFHSMNTSYGEHGHNGNHQYMESSGIHGHIPYQGGNFNTRGVSRGGFSYTSGNQFRGRGLSRKLYEHNPRNE